MPTATDQLVSARARQGGAASGLAQRAARALRVRGSGARVIQNSKLSALYVTAPQPKVSLKIIMKPKLVHTMIKHDSRMRQYSRVTSAFPEFIRPNGGGAVGSTAAIAEISRTRAATRRCKVLG